MRRRASRTSIAKAEVIRGRRWAIVDRIAVEIVEDAAGGLAAEDVDAGAVDVRAAVVADGMAAVVVDATRSLPRIFTDNKSLALGYGAATQMAAFLFAS